VLLGITLPTPVLRPSERRELRNYMKDAGCALNSGLKQAAARDRVQGEAHGVTFGGRHFQFSYS
jgi:hypothetical protein